MVLISTLSLEYITWNFIISHILDKIVKMECNKEHHNQGIEELCRICGSRVTKFDCKFECKKFEDEMLHCFAVDISSDVKGKYPSHFCKNCKRKLDKFKQKLKQNENGNKIHQPKQTVVLWGGTPCQVCYFLTASKRGGRKRKSNTCITSVRGCPPLKRIHTETKENSNKEGESSSTSSESSSAPPSAPPLPTEQSAVVTLLHTTTKLNTIPEFDTLLARAIKEKIQDSKTTKKPLDFGGTGSKHIRLQQIPSPSKSSKDACPRTVKQRSEIMKQIRAEISSSDSRDLIQTSGGAICVRSQTLLRGRRSIEIGK